MNYPLAEELTKKCPAIYLLIFPGWLQNKRMCGLSTLKPQINVEKLMKISNIFFPFILVRRLLQLEDLK